ncbi:MAG: hypothetical protein HOW73_35865 [Polyangiaceae bacterium]|nr:hypothetical protein [Polyangiaceae bacterium]
MKQTAILVLPRRRSAVTMCSSRSMDDWNLDEAGRASSTLQSVLGKTPSRWAEESDGLRRFAQALDALAPEGDPRALALRFAATIAAKVAASAETNADVFEKTAEALARIARDLHRFGWVKGGPGTPANDNAPLEPAVETSVLEVRC